MKILINEDNTLLKIETNNKLELNQIKLSLTRELPNAWIIKQKAPYANVHQSFLNINAQIPVGLWTYLINICKRYNIPIELSDKFKEYIKSFSFDKENFNQYINKLFNNAKTEKGENFKPYEYQIEAAYYLLKYKKSCAEISTSGGKTLISFILFKYLIHSGYKNILYIVPSVDLATQSAEKFKIYESYLNKHNYGWKVGILHSGLSDKEKEKINDCNILFGTYQSLCKKNKEFFNRFDVCIIDECHHSTASSIKKILNKLNNLIYCFGMTGTFPKEDKYENLVLQSYIGPLVYRLTANELIHREKRATPIYVVFEFLDYATKEEKNLLFNTRLYKDNEELNTGIKCLKTEQNFVNSSYIRMKYIADIAIKTVKNSMILFGDIKGGYGKKLYEYIKENSNKNVYYIDGSTPLENREFYKQQMEEDIDGRSIIVASIGTMGEGIDIKNLWSILLVNTAKSERIVRQICGRGLRQYPGKDKVVLFDFVDDLRFSLQGNYKKNNYLYKHYLDRKKIYMSQNFPIYSKKVQLEKIEK